MKYLGLKLGYHAFCMLYDNLERRQTQFFSFEQTLLDASSREVAIDVYVCKHLDCNDLAEKGYIFGALNEKQINLLMSYGIHSQNPILSRIIEGELNDSIAIRDFLLLATLHDMLFIVDKGFYSLQNIEMIEENNNRYIISVSSRMVICKTAELDSQKMERFVYANGRKA